MLNRGTGPGPGGGPQPGMRPGQMLTMVTCWIAGPAVVAAVIAAPAAVALRAG